MPYPAVLVEGAFTCFQPIQPTQIACAKGTAKQSDWQPVSTYGLPTASVAKPKRNSRKGSKQVASGPAKLSSRSHKSGSPSAVGMHATGSMLRDEMRGWFLLFLWLDVGSIPPQDLSYKQQQPERSVSKSFVGIR